MNRISWTDYFMSMVLLARTRSPDESTQHACIITNSKNQILGLGYNGFPRCCNDSLIDQTRPAKYDTVIHSEVNAILNANSNLQNCTVYVSGPPCIKCLSMMIQVGVVKIVYGPIVSTHVDSIYKTDPVEQLKKFHLHNDRKIQLIEWQPDDTQLLLNKLQDIKSILESY